MNKEEVNKRRNELLAELGATLADRQANRLISYKQEYDDDNIKKFTATSMAGLSSWLSKEQPTGKPLERRKDNMVTLYLTITFIIGFILGYAIHAILSK